jgi:hypothetical protein
MWPNSSDSSSVSVSAPQLTATNGARAARPLVKGARDQFLAGARLPVISTVLVVAATDSTRSKTASIGELRPMIPAERVRLVERALEQQVLLPQVPASSFSRTFSLSSSTSNGLTSNRTRPGACFDGGLGAAKAVIMIAGSAGQSAWRCATPRPAHVGHLDVRYQQVHAPRDNAASAILPFSASITSYPSRAARIASSSRRDRSSSATRIRPVRVAAGAGAGWGDRGQSRGYVHRRQSGAQSGPWYRLIGSKTVSGCTAGRWAGDRHLGPAAHF